MNYITKNNNYLLLVVMLEKKNLQSCDIMKKNYGKKIK